MKQNQLLYLLLLHSDQSTKLTNKKKDIAYAAIRVFAEKGFSNTSTAEIAKKAGVAEATIFKHFGSKENLLLTLMIPYIKELLPGMVDEVFAEILSADVVSYEQFLRKFLRNRIVFISENREVFQVFIKEILYAETLKAEFIPYFHTYAKPKLIGVIEHFQAQGEFPNMTSEEIFHMTFTFLAGLIVSKFVWANHTMIEEKESDAVVSFIVRGLKS